MTSVYVPWEKWTIKGNLGKGTFGVVYRIERLIGNYAEQSAMKVISIPSDQKFVENALREGYSLAEISQMCTSDLDRVLNEYNLMKSLSGNSNIVSCEDVEVIQKESDFGWDVYIRMELLTPLSLKIRNEPLSLIDIHKLGVDICKALVLCENKNIIHRDIKPENIFISDNGSYKLGDFGVARTLDHTTFATSAGTERYMAPEIVKREEYGKDVDVYSLGLVLYWLLNGRRMPFLTPGEIPTAQERETAHSRRLAGENLPEPAFGDQTLKNIVLKACAFDRKERYSSAQEMLDDLNNVVIKDNNYYFNLGESATSDANKTSGNAWADAPYTLGYDSVNQSAKDTTDKTTADSTQKPLNKETKSHKTPVIIVSIVALIAMVVAIMSLNSFNTSDSSTTSTNTSSESESSSNEDEKMFESSGETYTANIYSSNSDSNLRLAQDASGTWYAYWNDGSIAWNFTGFVSNDDSIWYVEEGKVAVDMTGTFVDGDGNVYKLEGGKVIED